MIYLAKLQKESILTQCRYSYSGCKKSTICYLNINATLPVGVYSYRFSAYQKKKKYKKMHFSFMLETLTFV